MQQFYTIPCASEGVLFHRASCGAVTHFGWREPPQAQNPSEHPPTCFLSISVPSSPRCRHPLSLTIIYLLTSPQPSFALALTPMVHLFFLYLDGIPVPR